MRPEFYVQKVVKTQISLNGLIELSLKYQIPQPEGDLIYLNWMNERMVKFIDKASQIYEYVDYQGVVKLILGIAGAQNRRVHVGDTILGWSSDPSRRNWYEISREHDVKTMESRKKEIAADIYDELIRCFGYRS